MNERVRNILLSLLGAVLLYLGWPPFRWPVTLFFAWIPWLFLLTSMQRSGKSAFRFWCTLLPGLMLWNILCTWWVWYASAWGAVAMVVCNSLLMAIPFQLAWLARMRFGHRLWMPALAIFWLGLEYLHHHWEINWPWLTLGNGLAARPVLVQWYEYTGTAGGSLWILLCNFVFFSWLRNRNYRNTVFAAVLIAVPVAFSWWLLIRQPFYSGRGPEVAVVQPSYDPYKEKFRVGGDEMVEEMIALIRQHRADSAALIVLPETALVGNFDERYMLNEDKVLKLRRFLVEGHRNTRILTGAETYETYYSKGKPTPTARTTDDPEVWWDAYNTALMIPDSGSVASYHKALLVPGVEKMPYADKLKFMEKLVINLDGISGSLGSSTEPVVFDGGSGIKTAPVICYESIFGDYVRQYVKKGANLICIITNDGWWYDTDGYRQHLMYASLRAIETRRCIARAANTGISGFIMPDGNLQQKTGWYEKTVIRRQLPLREDLTFFVKYGDLIGIAAFWLSGALWITLLVSGRFRNKKSHAF